MPCYLPLINRRNSGLIAALRAQGRKVLVDTEGEEEEEREGPEEGSDQDEMMTRQQPPNRMARRRAAAAGLSLPGGGSPSPLEPPFSTRRMRDLREAPDNDNEFEPPPAVVKGGRGSKGGSVSLGDPSPSSSSSSSSSDSWYSQLEAAGFAVRGGSGGGPGGAKGSEMFLERRVSQKQTKVQRQADELGEDRPEADEAGAASPSIEEGIKGKCTGSPSSSAIRCVDQESLPLLYLSRLRYLSPRR